MIKNRMLSCLEKDRPALEHEFERIGMTDPKIKCNALLELMNYDPEDYTENTEKQVANRYEFLIKLFFSKDWKLNNDTHQTMFGTSSHNS